MARLAAQVAADADDALSSNDGLHITPRRLPSDSPVRHLPAPVFRAPLNSPCSLPQSKWTEIKRRMPGRRPNPGKAASAQTKAASFSEERVPLFLPHQFENPVMLRVISWCRSFWMGASTAAQFHGMFVVGTYFLTKQHDWEAYCDRVDYSTFLPPFLRYEHFYFFTNSKVMMMGLAL